MITCYNRDDSYRAGYVSVARIRCIKLKVSCSKSPSDSTSECPLSIEKFMRERNSKRFRSKQSSNSATDNVSTLDHCRQSQR